MATYNGALAHAGAYQLECDRARHDFLRANPALAEEIGVALAVERGIHRYRRYNDLPIDPMHRGLVLECVGDLRRPPEKRLYDPSRDPDRVTVAYAARLAERGAVVDLRSLATAHFYTNRPSSLESRPA